LTNLNSVSIDLRLNCIADMDSSRILSANTKFLFLMNNNFQRITNLIFINNEALEYINYDNNQIREIEPSAFFSLNRLTFLSRNNSIKIIYDFMFSNFIHFDLLSNNVSIIYESSFKNVSSLYLDYSSLVVFKDLNYSYLKIQFLYLNNQKIERIIKNNLKGLYSKLDLSFNLLTSNSFEIHSFGYLPNLIEISFSNNLIAALDFNDAFQYNMSEIKLLNFENNKISTI
jgi:Leucine-rich repeat (LRR) protein